MNAPGAAIALATLPNLRDAGGWSTTDGRRVRRGLVYRSTALDRLDESDSAVLARLGIRTVVDLRTAPEREARPDRVARGVKVVVADVLADSQLSAPAQLKTFFSDPATAAAFLASGQAEEALRSAYRESILLPSARAGYGAFMRAVLDTDGAVLYHCTTGKDRTGWATASLLTLLGVAEPDVYADYLLTNEQLIPALEPLILRFEAAGVERVQLMPVLGVDRTYLDTAFETMSEHYGTIERYLADGLGIGETEQERLRDHLLE
jgi:protein-tyrosine phosphatase